MDNSAQYKNYNTEQNSIRYKICNNLLNNVNINQHLDVGSFDGRSFDYIDSNKKFAIEPSSIGNKSLNDRRVEVIASTVEEYSGDRKFDLITFFDVLEHLFDPLSALKKSYSLLNSGGYVCYTFPNDVYNLKNLIKLFSNPKEAPILKYKNNGHIRFFSLGTATQMAIDSGFDVIEAKGYGNRKILNKFLPNQFCYGYFILAKKVG
jgi:SAM-dependent methyltransferase